MVVIDNIEGAIDISDFHEVRLEDTGLYFGYRIELLWLNGDMLAFLGCHN